MTSDAVLRCRDEIDAASRTSDLRQRAAHLQEVINTIQDLRGAEAEALASVNSLAIAATKLTFASLPQKPPVDHATWVALLDVLLALKEYKPQLKDQDLLGQRFKHFMESAPTSVDVHTIIRIVQTWV